MPSDWLLPRTRRRSARFACRTLSDGNSAGRRGHGSAWGAAARARSRETACPAVRVLAWRTPRNFAERIRKVIGGRDGVAERKMFGGIGWMVSGNLACGMMGDSLLGRLDRDDTGAGLRGVAGTEITVCRRRVKTDPPLPVEF